MKKLNFKDLPCPQPVIQTKKALSEGGFSSLEIIVDNEPAKENVLRFLKSSKCKVEEVLQDNNLYTIIASVSDVSEKKSDSNIAEDEENRALGKCYVIGTESMGVGDDKLGSKLMSAFFYTLSEYDIAPKDIFFLNGGIKHCIEGSENIEILSKISNRGTEITACGTCLDFYGVTDKLKIGKIGNLYDLVSMYNGKSDIINIA